VKQIILEQGLVFRAPALSKDQVLSWAAKTIHGGLRTMEPTRSRRSFTAPLIPGRSRLLQYQTRMRPLETEVINDMKVHHPKDLSKAANRTFQMTERAAIKLVTSRSDNNRSQGSAEGKSPCRHCLRSFHQKRSDGSP
jgi:phytanoyl-CoA hydroxylase